MSVLCNPMDVERKIFNELRVVGVNINANGEYTDDNLIKVMTINEELKSLGYTLNPKDILVLSKANDLDTFMKRFRQYIPDVKAKPMYPNFPKEVMNLDEATFRFHQMLHYLSTYGIESITGTSVSKGWLPEAVDTEKVKDDTTLLNAKVIQLITNTKYNTVYDYAYFKILSKRERMTDKEIDIIKDILPIIHNCNVEIPFKQNLLLVFDFIFNSKNLDNYTKRNNLHELCQHTGDVWKCIDYSLTRCKFHFKTSQKRLLVKLLESYPTNNFESNLILSNKKAQRTLLMLNYLDYNKYSKSSLHKEFVKSFRNSNLKSWESKAKLLIGHKDNSALRFICEHPGVAVRNLTYLLRNGYDKQDIYLTLRPYVCSLSTQTLISLCTYFGQGMMLEEHQYPHTLEESDAVYEICHSLLRDKFLGTKTLLCAKKVYFDFEEYNLDKSLILTNDKSSEGGYIRSGIAYNIPENVNRLRFFVYWNDKDRVDVDLHACIVDNDNLIGQIGWCSDFNSKGVIFSGDITHSDAAEYIDIDLTTAQKYNIKEINFNINLYSGAPYFKDITECYIGIMAVDNIGEDVKLYNPKNCFFVHELKSTKRNMNYGYIDLKNRCLILDAENASSDDYYCIKHRVQSKFTLHQYLKDIVETQNVYLVDNKEDADIILVMGKPNSDKEISLIDNNFFMDM